MADLQRLQAHAARWQRIARMRGVRRVFAGFSPLNEGGQAAIKKALAVVAHGDAPVQKTRRRLARLLQHGPAVQPNRGQRLGRGVHPLHANHKVNQLRPLLRDARLQQLVVHVKPAAQLGGARRPGLGVQRNNFKVGARKGRAGDAEKPVVRPHQRVLATGRGCHAQHALGPGHAFGQRRGHHHQVIQLGV